MFSVGKFPAGTTELAAKQGELTTIKIEPLAK
jgi:hypothetical protein